MKVDKELENLRHEMMIGVFKDHELDEVQRKRFFSQIHQNVDKRKKKTPYVWIALTTVASVFILSLLIISTMNQNQTIQNPFTKSSDPENHEDYALGDDGSEENEDSDVDKSIKNFAANSNKYIQKVPEDSTKLHEAGFGEIYNFFLIGGEINHTITKIEEEMEIKNENLKKDLQNFKKLYRVLSNSTIEHAEKKFNGDGKKAWRNPTDRMKDSVVYMQALINDMNLKINNKEGQEYGFSYIGNGENIQELEGFINGDELGTKTIPEIFDDKGDLINKEKYTAPRGYLAPLNGLLSEPSHSD